jgi:hypothetical protein
VTLCALLALATADLSTGFLGNRVEHVTLPLTLCHLLRCPPFPYRSERRKRSAESGRQRA